MTQLKKRSIWTLVIWSIVLIGLCAVFFSEGGAKTFLDGERRVTITRSFLTAGFIFYFLLLFLTRTGRKASAVFMDERDVLIAKRALMAGFYVLLIYIFLLSLILYWYYKLYVITLEMPVGWMWFIGVSSFCLGYISQAAATLILDSKMGGNGQG
jgi:hypothetical protein